MYNNFLKDFEENNRLLQKASELSKKCPNSDTAFSVGAIIKTRDGTIFTGYSREFGGNEHAEEVAIDKAVRAGKNLVGAILYCSLEPCSERASRPMSCTQHIINHKFARVFISQREDETFVPDCQGVELLRAAGIDVVEMGAEK